MREAGYTSPASPVSPVFPTSTVLPVTYSYSGNANTPVGSRVRVKPGLKFQHFTEGSSGTVTSVNADSTLEVLFDDQSVPLPVAHHHLEFLHGRSRSPVATVATTHLPVRPRSPLWPRSPLGVAAAPAATWLPPPSLAAAAAVGGVGAYVVESPVHRRPLSPGRHPRYPLDLRTSPVLHERSRSMSPSQRVASRSVSPISPPASAEGASLMAALREERRAREALELQVKALMDRALMDRALRERQVQDTGAGVPARVGEAGGLESDTLHRSVDDLPRPLAREQDEERVLHDRMQVACVADNSALKADAPGTQYQFSTNVDDKDASERSLWRSGTTPKGTGEWLNVEGNSAECMGGEWLNVEGSGYLPMRMAVPRDWVAKTLKAHNDLRARHGAPPLRWSDECCQAAQVQASACQSRGSLFHGNQEGRSGHHGQNAFFGGVPGADAGDVVQMWYDEVAKYNFRRPGFAPGTGHFTQVVWADSTHVGMARSADGRFVVANYFPAGNVCSPGLFERNVRPAGSKSVRPRRGCLGGCRNGCAIS